MNFPEKGVYDFIFGDAYNDLSIPYHLTTKEFADMLRSLLKPDGMLIANIIDHFETASSCLPTSAPWRRSLGRERSRSSPIRRLKIGDQHDYRRGQPRRSSLEGSGKKHPESCFILDPDEVDKKLQSRFAVVLTDDYAPVDNLIAPIFEERFGKKKKWN